MNENLKKVHDLLTSALNQDLPPAIAEGPNVVFSWNNYYGSWVDGGWNNYYGSWVDKGWNNYYGSWVDQGWNNYYGSWSDKGWNNYYGSWGDSGNNSSGGCFLTTACVKYKQLPDDCYELQVLRAVRDTIVEWDDANREMVLEYYRIAPQIVEKIESSGNSGKVWEDLYNNLIIPCVNFYEKQQIQEAVNLYVSTVTALKKQYLDT